MNRILLPIICCLLLCSCGTKETIYFDFQLQAIVSCSGTIKEVGIETPLSTVIIKGPVKGKPVYLNKQNPDYNIIIDNETQTDYVFSTQPNTTYVVWTEKGVDTGSGALTFRTDGSGKIVKASRSYCNL